MSQWKTRVGRVLLSTGLCGCVEGRGGVGLGAMSKFGTGSLLGNLTFELAELQLWNLLVLPPEI